MCQHACSGEPAGRPETQTQAAANHCGPQVTEHQVYIVVASAVYVCLSHTHRHSHTHTHTHNQYVQRRSNANSRRQTSQPSTTRRRTYSRRTVAVEACTSSPGRCVGTTVVHCLSLLVSSLHCTTPSHIPSSHFSLLIEAHAYMHVASATEREEDKNACIYTCFERAKTQMACTHPYVKHVSTVPYSCAADMATRAVVTAMQRATYALYVVLRNRLRHRAATYYHSYTTLT